MTKYLLDANVLIDWLKGKEPALSAVGHLIEHADVAAINAITLAELHSGLADEQRLAVDELLNAFEYWLLEPSEARLAGYYRYKYARQGIRLAVPDTLLAAQAILRGATLVTDNLREFPMPELVVLRPESPNIKW